MDEGLELQVMKVQILQVQGQETAPQSLGLLQDQVSLLPTGQPIELQVVFLRVRAMEMEQPQELHTDQAAVHHT